MGVRSCLGQIGHKVSVLSTQRLLLQVIRSPVLTSIVGDQIPYPLISRGIKVPPS